MENQLDNFSFLFHRKIVIICSNVKVFGKYSRLISPSKNAKICKKSEPNKVCCRLVLKASSDIKATIANNSGLITQVLPFHDTFDCAHIWRV